MGLEHLILDLMKTRRGRLFVASLVTIVCVVLSMVRLGGFYLGNKIDQSQFPFS